MNEHVKGFYWVKMDGEYVIAEFRRGVWQIPGSELKYVTDQLDYVGEMVRTPPPSEPRTKDEIVYRAMHGLSEALRELESIEHTNPFVKYCMTAVRGIMNIVERFLYSEKDGTQ